jgi:hypothetical protein
MSERAFCLTADNTARQENVIALSKQNRREREKERAESEGEKAGWCVD